MATLEELKAKNNYVIYTGSERLAEYLTPYGVDPEDAYMILVREEEGKLVELWYMPMSEDNEADPEMTPLVHPDAEAHYNGPSAFPRLRPGRYINHSLDGYEYDNLQIGWHIVNQALAHGWTDADVQGSGPELQVKNADGKFEPFFQSPYLRRRDLTIEAATQYLEQLCAEQVPGYKWTTDEEGNWGVFPTDTEEEEEDLDHYSKEARSVYSDGKSTIKAIKELDDALGSHIVEYGYGSHEFEDGEEEPCIVSQDNVETKMAEVRDLGQKLEKLLAALGAFNKEFGTHMLIHGPASTDTEFDSEEDIQEDEAAFEELNTLWYDVMEIASEIRGNETESTEEPDPMVAKFIVTTISRQEVANILGIDGKKALPLSDAEMQEIADKMEEMYIGSGYFSEQLKEAMQDLDITLD